MVIGVWLCALGTHDQIPKLTQPADTDRFSARNLLTDIGRAFRIPSFSAVVSASIVSGMNQGMAQALMIYTATYFFELTPSQMPFLFTGGVIGVLMGSLLTRPLSNLVPEKKHLYMAGVVFYGITTTYVVILRLLDLIPPNSDPLIAPLYIISAGVSGVGLGVYITLGASMIADITDEHERRYGKRQEGIYYAAASFAGKAIGGSGAIFAGIIIDFAGIPQGAAPSEVSQEAITRFGWALGPAVLAMMAIALACISFYSISRAEHADIMREIRGRTPDAV